MNFFLILIDKMICVLNVDIKLERQSKNFSRLIVLIYYTEKVEIVNEKLLGR